MDKRDKDKIAFIVQRYGAEINGGAEQHCRLLAEKLKSHYDVDVLTSCAESYRTWENHFAPGVSDINGVRVIRFPTSRPRSKNRNTYRFLRRRRLFQKALKGLGLLSWTEKLFPALQPTNADFVKWLTEQGCPTPELITYLTHNQQGYKVLIFFTYLYYPTAIGIEVAPQKSILIPTAHNEPSIYISFFKKVFNSPSAIIYNTAFEKKFVNALFENEKITDEVAGIGIDINYNSIDVKSMYRLEDDYVLYVGRVEPGKGCKILVEYFQKYKALHKSGLKLLLVGQVFMPLPKDPSIISLGFVSDDIKFNLIQQASLLIMPSFYESLSMVTLESMKLQTPVLVNGNCEVLKQHVMASKAGFAYYNYKDFEKALSSLISNEALRREMGAAGKNYVENAYSWERIINIFDRVISRISAAEGYL